MMFTMENDIYRSIKFYKDIDAHHAHFDVENEYNMSEHNWLPIFEVKFNVDGVDDGPDTAAGDDGKGKLMDVF